MSEKEMQELELEPDRVTLTDEEGVERELQRLCLCALLREVRTSFGRVFRLSFFQKRKSRKEKTQGMKRYAVFSSRKLARRFPLTQGERVEHTIQDKVRGAKPRVLMRAATSDRRAGV